MDGMIYAPLGLSQRGPALTNVSYPLILIRGNIFSASKDQVTMKNVEATFGAAQYLLDLGQTSIAVIGTTRHEIKGSYGLRLQRYTDVFEAAGIEYDEGFI